MTSSAVAAALGAVFFSCAPRQPAAPARYALCRDGAVVGRVEKRTLPERRDADGPFVPTLIRLTLRRWADGAGVVTDDLEVVAVRRAGGPVYYARGSWDGGVFRYRAADTWRLWVRDEFGNEDDYAGAVVPDLCTFRGVPLPLAASARRPGARVTTLELTDGVSQCYCGIARAGGWVARDRGAYLRLAYDAAGEPTGAAGFGGVDVVAGAGPSRQSFLYKKPPLAFLGGVWARPAEGLSFAVAVRARLAGAASAEALTAPGQDFAGVVAGDYIDGVFTVNAAGAAPLTEGSEGFRPAASPAWPLMQGDGELARLARRFRAAGKEVSFVSGVGLFWGNLFAPYSWLEVDGAAVAAPARPVPAARVVLARGERSVDVLSLAVSRPTPAPKNFREFGRRIPGLGAGAELTYDFYRGGAPAGRVVVLYDAPAESFPLVYYDAEVLGKRYEGGAFGAFADGDYVRPFNAAGGSWAEFVALGAAVATRTEDAEPIYEFCLPGVNPRGVCRVRWRGMKPLAVGAEWRLARVYTLEPGGFTAYYTYDGVLLGLACRRFTTRLRSLPARKATGAPAAPISEGEEPR